MPTPSRPPHRPRAGWHGPTALVVLAGAIWTLGVCVYLTDRAASHTILLPSIDWLAGRHLFGALGGWLPGFVHPFVFSLLTALALPAVPTARYGACVAWCVVNIAFECGQHPQIREPLALMLHRLLDPIGLGRPLANYFLRGTFDVGDVVAAVLGALAAAGALWVVQRRTETSGAP